MTWQDTARELIERMAVGSASSPQDHLLLERLKDEQKISESAAALAAAQDQANEAHPEDLESVVAPAAGNTGEHMPSPPPPLVSQDAESASEPELLQPTDDPGMPAELVDTAPESVPDAIAAVQEGSAGEDAAAYVPASESVAQPEPRILVPESVRDAQLAEILRDEGASVFESQVNEYRETAIVPENLPFEFTKLLAQVEHRVELPPVTIVEEAGTALPLPEVPELVFTTEHAEAALGSMGDHLRSLERRRI